MFLKMEDNFNSFQVKATYIFLKMEDNLNFLKIDIDL